MDDDESDERKGACIVGEFGRGVMSLEGNKGGIASEIVGESGPICCLSWIDTTIFSRPSDVMCFSLPRLAVIMGLSVRGGEVLMLRGADGEHSGSSVGSDSSEATESTLDESSGMSFFFGLGLGSFIAVVVDFRGWVSQHMVSRPHIRQLRFSSLRPSSTVSAHFEKTADN